MRPVPFVEWTRRGVWGSPAPFRGTAKAVIIHHSVTRVAGRNALEQVRDIEDVIYSRRFEAGFSMIAYSAVVAGSGAAFIGRGFQYRNGANTRTKTSAPPYDNSNTFSICFAGDYRTLSPTAAQLAAASNLIRDGIAAGRIIPNPPVLPHSALHSTVCPGPNLVAALGGISTEGHPMPLHPDAEAARQAGIWNGSDQNQPATREHAAIMAWRAREQAIEAAEVGIAAAVAELLIDGAGPPVELGPGESVTIRARPS